MTRHPADRETDPQLAVTQLRRQTPSIGAGGNFAAPDPDYTAGPHEPTLIDPARRQCAAHAADTTELARLLDQLALLDGGPE